MKIRKVPPELGGTSVISFVAGHSAVSDRKQIMKLISRSCVKINGAAAASDAILAPGDIVEIYDGDYSAARRVDAVYEDRNYIIVNKRPGILTSGDGQGEYDLTEAVNTYLMSNDEFIETSGNIAYPCNRIDKYAGGLVIYAKSGEMFDIMLSAIVERRVVFTYLALVCGALRPGQSMFLQNYISENESKPFIKLYDTQVQGSRVAAARVTGIRTNGSVSLVRCVPVTHLRHQLRGQLAVAGYPVLGDQEYGSKKMNLKYAAKHQAIWCSAVKFETGSNNPLVYLDGQTVETSHILFPYVDLSSGN